MVRDRPNNDMTGTAAGDGKGGSTQAPRTPLFTFEANDQVKASLKAHRTGFSTGGASLISTFVAVCVNLPLHGPLH